MKRTFQLLFLLLPFMAAAQAWQPKQAKLMSVFAKDVDPNNVLPEYPRPQLERSQWMNLNGVWEYQSGTSANETQPQGKLSGSILVPFPVESALSGVMEHHDRLWYRRAFTVPADWKKLRVLLHFGAVDYEAEVFVNGKSVGIHQGGYNPFSFDITPYLEAGEQELTVRVFDPTDNAGIPRGKQSLNPVSIMYTAVTGIWQTVWLEPVPEVHIETLKIVPDIDRSVLRLTVNTGAANTKISVAVKDGDKTVQEFFGNSNSELIVPVPNAKLWSPASPFLYNLEVKLAGKNADRVNSYFGMRKIAVQEEEGFKKLFLNNKFLFEMGPLDQGFWPDGGYTAPTDAALRYDLEITKALGFNLIRKHIKVEPYRWYYWADKLGLMVWQDMPSINSYNYAEVLPPIEKEAFKTQLQEMVKDHWNSPCIVMWVVFNEMQGQHDTHELVSMVKALDPSRLVNQGSGCFHFGVGDMIDNHSYPHPSCPVSQSQAIACGEFGGMGLKIEGHCFDGGFGTVMAKNEDELIGMYRQNSRELAMMKTSMGMSAAVYVQTTDVEGEVNGFLTYDRAVIKADTTRIRQCNELAISGRNTLEEKLTAPQSFATQWKLCKEKPAENWVEPGFDDSKWKTAKAGIGLDEKTYGPEATQELWFRQEVVLDNFSAEEIAKLALFLYADVCEVYINGVKASEITPNLFTKSYSILKISEEAKKAIRPGARNILAVHRTPGAGFKFWNGAAFILKDVTNLN